MMSVYIQILSILMESVTAIFTRLEIKIVIHYWVIGASAHLIQAHTYNETKL